MPRGRERARGDGHFRRWGAAYLLLGLFLGSWVGQLLAQRIEVASEARAHGESFSWSDFWPRFFSATFENWQSEWLQLLVQAAVLLGLKHVLFKADAEDVERMDAKLDRLLAERGIDPRAVEREVEG